MKSHTSRTVGTLRRLILLTALLISPLLAVPSGNAQSVAAATLTSGGANTITIDSNGSFTLTLAVTTNFIAGGYTVFYQSNNGQGLFQVTALNYLDPIFVLGANPPFPLLLNPSTMFDLGATTLDTSITHPLGTFNLQSVNIQMLNAPIGTYSIFLDTRSVMTELTGGGTFVDIPMSGPTGPMFTVNVVPEPTMIGLVVMGVAVGLGYRLAQAARCLVRACL